MSEIEIRIKQRPVLRLSRETVIPEWARLLGRRRAGEAEIDWTLLGATWAVPVRLCDGEPQDLRALLAEVLS